MRIVLIALGVIGTVATTASCEDDSAPAPTSSGVTSSTAASGGGGGGAGGEEAGGGGAGGGALDYFDVLYLANQNGDSIAWFHIADDGGLSEEGSVRVAHPGPLASDPTQERLYAGLVGPNQVATFAIDPSSGGLSHLATSAVGINPVYLAVDHAGSHLLVASYGANAVQVHPFAGDGSVESTPVANHSPGTNPHAVLVHPSDDWVFVPVTNGDDGVAQYAYDAGSGALTPNGVVDTDAVGPRHLVLHPTLDRLYVVNEHADSVTTYVVDPAAGTLAPLAPTPTVTTLPAGFDGANNTCADIHITPDGSFVYASNRGHDSIAMFAVDPTTGALSAIGHAPTEARPREFEITPDGRYLYAAGQDSNMLAAYRIESDGQLSPLASYPTGDTPMWVLALRFIRR